MKTTDLLFNFNESPPILTDLNLMFEFITRGDPIIFLPHLGLQKLIMVRMDFHGDQELMHKLNIPIV